VPDDFDPLTHSTAPIADDSNGTDDPTTPEPAGGIPAAPASSPVSAERTSDANRTTRSPRVLRASIASAVVAALVGAGVASAVFVATDDNSTVRTTTVVQAATPVKRSSDRLAGNALDIAGVINKVEPAVVAVVTDDGPGSGNGGAGTGFVITSDGYIVTNNHVVEGANHVEVTFTNGDQHSATVKGTDPSADLAVIKVNASNLPTVQLGDSDKVQVGDDVVAIGNALALEGGLSVTKGIVSGLHRDVPVENGLLSGALQTDAAINPGNSGGPLVNAQGQVIGINTAIASPAQENAVNVGFVIPISNAKPIIDDLMQGRTPAFLGVATQTVTPNVARELRLSVQSGAVISQVTNGSPAADAGLRRDDVIVEIDGHAITGSSDVLTRIREHRPGDRVEIVVNRDGTRKTAEATLAKRPSQ